MKTRTITQIGIMVDGYTIVNHWGGGEGRVRMDPVFIPNDKITHNNIYRAINDGQFGCEAIKEADVDVYIKYDNGSLEFDRTLCIDRPEQLKQAMKGIQ